MKYKTSVKRFLDIVLSLLLLLILSPLFLVIMVVLRVSSSAPVIFSQKRIGKGGKPFHIYKFRTMRSGTPEKPTRELAEEEYVSFFGAFLRRFGLDELPQLINIIRGDMSLIGPRPLIPDEKEMHEMRHALGVYEVSPGLTGLAQIRSGEITSLSEKAAADAEYVRNISFSGDVKILLRTVGKMLSSKGIKENIRS